jgi:hypothetical protein
MRNDKIEALIRTFTAEIEALMRDQLRDEVTRALDLWLSGKPPARANATAKAKSKATAATATASTPATATDAATDAPAPAADAKVARRGWTREAVIAELATWLLTGTVIEAAFLNRQGKPGLVAAARKHFGRFDAALNAANVHLARLHPEGPPTAKRRASTAAQ